jgi:amino acid adenylation domain-containing protein
MNKGIAIIGMAGRFPDAKTLDELVGNLKEGKDSVREISWERLCNTTLPLDREYKMCGYLEDVDKFDHQFFNISLAEAQTMEPNQRILLEVAYEVFENAGYSIDDWSGTNTSIYVSEARNDYYKHADRILPTLITGNASEFLAARLGRQYNLRGTAAMVNTSCSSSLAAVHLACNELILGEADCALVCSVNIDLFPYNDNSLNLGLLSPDGKSRAFSAQANGMSRGELAAGVLLKPLDKAIKDRDIIHAVIKGAAVNNNANRSASLSAPDSHTLAEVLNKAWEKAGIDPTDIGFIEAHGSGTELGDTLEIEGMNLAFAQYTDKKKWCPISTIKSNTGHGVFASGMAGLIKTILSLKHRVIFPTIHFQEPNPLVDFEQSAVYVNDQLKMWEKKDGKPRIAGVTSIGFSGTNCHMVLQESPPLDEAGEKRTLPRNGHEYLFTISSRSPEGLKGNLHQLLGKIEGINRNGLDPSRLSDISYTLTRGRKHFNYRYACIAHNLDSLRQKIAEAIDQAPHCPPRLEKLLFIFSDHEDIPAGLIDLFRSRYPVFERYFSRCQALVDTEQSSYSRDFAFQFSLYQLLESCDIITENLLSVGIGKIVSDLISGDITLEQAAEKVLVYKPESVPELEQRVQKLIENETGSEPTAFIDMGPGGMIAEELMRQNTGNQRFYVFRLYDGTSNNGNKAPLLELLKFLYLANYTLNWEKCFLHREGRKLELPGYQFQGVRCWLREQPLEPIEASTPAVSSYPLYREGNEIEEKIAKFWQEALEVDQFYLEDDFFEKGGDSLRATRVINRVNQLFMVNLSFEDIFDFPTIKLLSEYVANLLGTEQKVAISWKEVLKAQHVEPGDSFFELGGHSLLATQVLNQVKKEFHLELNFEDFFAHPTLASFSQYIDEMVAKGENTAVYSTVPRVEKKEHYPLSYAQKRFYFLQQKEKENTSYNGTQVLLLEGELEKVRLERTFRELIKRHESLRTSFLVIEGEPRQKVHEPVEIHFAMEYYEVGERNVEPLIRAFIRVFDLSCAPLLRGGLIQIGDNRHIFLADVHHIISDGTSVSIMIRDFLRLYREEELSPLTIQYKDFALWQAASKNSIRLKQQENYWLSVFAGELPILNLNTDYPRSTVPVDAYEGDTVYFEVSKEIWKKLGEIEKKTGATLFMVLMAAYNTLLMKYTGQEDIITGSLVQGRTHTDLYGIIGVFVETLALRYHPLKNQSFLDFLHQVRENSLNAFKYSGYPFEELLKKLQYQREMNRSPLFDTMFLLQSYEHTRFSVEGLECSPYKYQKNVLYFDLRWTAVEKEDEIYIEMDYARKLFKRETAEQLARHYVQVLRKVGDHPGKTLQSIELLSTEEKQQLLEEFCTTGTRPLPGETLCQLMEEQVLRTPDTAAVEFEDAILSYWQLNQRANWLARQLRAAGIGAGQPMGILLERSIPLVEGIWATWKAGAAYIPIDTQYPARRVTDILADANAPVLLSDSRHLDKEITGEYAGKIIELDREKLILEKEDIENPEPEPDIAPRDPAYIIYTSGSTGKPKGAVVEHIGMLNHIQAKINHLQITANSIIAQNASYTFDISVWQFFAPLAAGGKTVIYPNELVMEPGRFISRLSRDRITILEVVPSYLSIMLGRLQAGRDQLKKLEFLVVTGEALGPQLAARWFEKYPGIKLVNAYGPTEASDDITHHIIEGAFSTGQVPIGKPLQNLNIYIVDEQMKLCPVGVSGEIWVSGTGVGRGYLNNPGRTCESFMADPFAAKRGVRLYKTGDFGRWHREGSIEFLGRMDYQVKIRGFRIELEEIEKRLLNHEKIKEAVVLARDRGAAASAGGNTGDKYLCAYYTSGEELALAGLRQYLSAELPHYMIPAYFVRLEKMPLTPHGKIDRKLLPEPDQEAEVPGSQYEEAVTESEKKLVKVWQEVLGTEKIGIWDNFFELGGDSLMVIQVTARIREVFGVELPVKKFFDRPFIKSLSDEVESHAEEAIFIKPMPADAKIPLSFAQERLWFLQELNPDNTAYHVPRAIRIKGDLDISLVERTITEIIRRHEILRTTFPTIDGEPVQQIQEPYPIKIPVIDLSRMEEREQEDYISKWLLEEGQRLFDFEKGPLLRMHALKLKPDEHLITSTEHHLVHDGWAGGVFLNEFITLFTAFFRGEPSPLPALAIQYKDFAYWQRDYLRGEVLEKHLEYWKKKLSGMLPVLNLPLDRPRPAVNTGRGNEKDLFLSRELSVALEEFSRVNKVTLFMTMLAALKVLLFRYSGCGDLCVGSGMANRAYKELKNMLGMVINTLPLRTRVSGDLSFRLLLQRVKTTCCEAYEHQDTPLEKIVNAVNQEKNLSYNPLFQVVFSFLDTPRENVQLPGLEIYVESSHNQSSKFDFNIVVEPPLKSRPGESETQGRIEIDWEYNTDLFDDQTIGRFLEHYTDILKQVIEDKDIRIKDIKLSHSFQTANTDMLKNDTSEFIF